MSVRGDILDSIELALKGMIDNSSYPSNVKEIKRFAFSLNVKEKYKSPSIYITDVGSEQLSVRDSTHYRYIWDVALSCYVMTSSKEQVQDKLNAVVADVKKLIDSPPTLDASVLEWRLTGTDSVWYDPTAAKGAVHLLTEVRYVAANGVF